MLSPQCVKLTFGHLHDQMGQERVRIGVGFDGCKSDVVVNEFKWPFVR